MTADLQEHIERRLSGTRPEVEVILVEPSGAGKLRVTIDHPEGVTLDLCEAVTGDLAELRDRYALEVSSPGTRRPLTRPSHYRRFTGRRAKLRLAGGGDSLTGEITAAGDIDVTVSSPEGVATIPYDQIKRANLIEE